MALSVGTVVAGYTIEGVLGRGGMGTVYRAANPSLPRSDAFKVLSSEWSHNEEFRARFLREADLAATLDHPNIVAVYNRGETVEGQLWIAMQLVEGSDADKEMRAGRMTSQRAIHIIGEVAKALDYAHRRNILHRDVKPANFLLTDDDERIFLADFGIARAADEAVGLTQSGMVMASAAYASPESLRGETVDHRADIYSLGCSLYRLLTQKTPFSRSGGVAAVTAGHLFEPPPKVTAELPQLPPAIDDVIAIAMAKDRHERYPTAREFARAAAQALDETTAHLPRATTHGWPTPVPPVPPSAGPPAKEPLTYPTGHFSGPQAPTVPLEHFPGAGPPQQFAPPPPAPKRASRRRIVLAATMAAVVLTVAAVVAAMVFLPDSNYQPQSFSHMHGTTDLKTAPTAVAALGPGDGDAVLSLGIQPVALTAPNTQLPSWEQQALTGTPKIMAVIDTAAIAATRPDVIIATGDIDDDTYQRLAAIAPTITRPDQNATQGWNWENQLKWIGRIVGAETKAGELITATQSLASDLRNQNPAFSGKSVQAVVVSDAGVAQVLTPSNAATYLDSLGLQYNSQLQRNDVDTGTTRPVSNTSELFGIETDVLVVIRSDQGAGHGGFAGLPKPLTVYQGLMVIADDPNVVAALLAEPGGYLATQFLDHTFAPQLARQVR